MSRTDTEWAAWAKQHRVAFEVAPLMEAREGEKLQVGFALSLYAEIPMDLPPGKQRQEAGGRLKDELRACLEDAVPPAQRVAGVQMEPPRTAVLRPENELRPEISLTWRIFHADQYLKAVSEADRGRLTAFEKRLVAMGLRHGHW